MTPKTRDVKIRHTILKRGGKIRSRRFHEGGYEHFNVRVFVDGDIEDLQSVEYQLHPTFPNPHRVRSTSGRGGSLRSQ
jgi:transcription initiation factor IIF auxiliary subunit